MPDPYQPALASFAFTPDEDDAIAQALLTPKPWDWEPGGDLEDLIGTVKTKIRDLHMQRHDHSCAYCRWSMLGGGHFVVDREHVLPKSSDAYRLYAFTMWNLTVACKRCNLQYKGRKDDFVVDKVNAAAWQNSTNYLLIHPNFDRYDEHIAFVHISVPGFRVTKYVVNKDSEKGAYTYGYFNLASREKEFADEGQVGKLPQALGEFALAARKLAEDYGQ